MAKVKKKEKEKEVVSIHRQVVTMANDLEELFEDAEKFDGGNGAAGTRVRKGLFDVRNRCFEIRKEISMIKNSNKY